MAGAGELFYSEVSSTNQNFETHFINSQIQNYESNPPNFTNLSENNSAMWKLFVPKAGNNIQVSNPSSSKTMNEDSMNLAFFDQINHKPDFQSTVSGDSWQENKFLSLSSTYPSSIGLQSFHQDHDQQSVMRLISTNFSGKVDSFHERQIFQDGLLEKDGSFQSKYLNPVKELLNELCCLSTNRHDPRKIRFVSKSKQWEEKDLAHLSRHQSLSSVDIMELHKRKTKLFSMLQEVERRYSRYCDQMKKVVSSFEEIAGHGAASVYLALASRAMSRHFRTLKSEIVNQIQATKKAIGDKNSSGVGSTKGETPRLRLLDQTLRQHRAFQQMNLLQTQPWRPQRGLPERSVSILRAWLFEHFLHPYPSDIDKHVLARQTGLSRSQVSNWFINARVRLWKPMVEEMYTKETKENDDDEENNIGVDNVITSSADLCELDENGPANKNPRRTQNQKPNSDQLMRIDSECLSSIINNSASASSRNNKTFDDQILLPEQNFGGVVRDGFGSIELNFSSHNNHLSDNGGANRNSINGGRVSLTLGLQSLAFSPSSQTSLYYHRNHLAECQPIQYSLLDDESQNLPYTNLI